MIKLVIDNLRPSSFAHRFIFICQRADVSSYGLVDKFSRWAPNSSLVEIDGLTEGAVCTALAARDLINNDSALIIANSDQYVDVVIDDYLATLEERYLDASIITMKANDPKWSFVELAKDGNVSKVVEKEPISDEATVGIYSFRRGSDFVRAADAMIKKDLRVNGEFYVAPTYNQLIAEGLRIGIHNVGSVGDGMYGLGTPADLEEFLNLPLSHRLTQLAT